MASKAVGKRSLTPKTLQPSSPFGALLRRSNFASYDPCIRQTYAAPASYVHRGNWGLKRPIANHKRHSTIVLRNFEEHAHYIEWDKAPAQVDFVRRVEELNIQPMLQPSSPWSLSLGPNADLIDSEFSPHQWKPKRTRAKEAALEMPVEEPEPVLELEPETPLYASAPRPKRSGVPQSFAHLGQKGPGSYGNKLNNRTNVVSVDEESYIQPNIAAMTPTQFEKYLEELRQLRPEFKQYIRAEIQKRRPAANGGEEQAGIDPAALADEEIIMNLASESTEKSLHRYFLGKHAREKFTSHKKESTKDLPPAAAQAVANMPQPIQPQPHQLGGLIYSKPTLIETYYSGHAAPGLILQNMNQTQYFHKGRDSGYVAAFAGITSRLDKKTAGSDINPLFDPFTEEGITPRRIPNAAGTGVTIDLKDSIRDMRMIELKLEAPPKVVGNVPNQSMRSVKVDASVAVNDVVGRHERGNPHRPGTREFNSCNPAATKKGPKQDAGNTPGWQISGRHNAYLSRRNPQLPVGIGESSADPKAENQKTMSMLLGLTDLSKGRAK